MPPKQPASNKAGVSRKASTKKTLRLSAGFRKTLNRMAAVLEQYNIDEAKKRGETATSEVNSGVDTLTSPITSAINPSTASAQDPQSHEHARIAESQKETHRCEPCEKDFPSKRSLACHKGAKCHKETVLMWAERSIYFDDAPKLIAQRKKNAEMLGLDAEPLLITQMNLGGGNGYIKR